MKLIQISDLHIIEPGEKIYGLDPLQRLNTCIADININHSDAECCVITGDLTDRGEIDAYQALREVLAQLRIPFYLLLGNHDDRRRFLEVFPESEQDGSGFVQYTRRTAVGDFFFLDTLDQGKSGGLYCESRREWLRQRLQESDGRSVYLFMHHPPFDIGIRGLDAIRLMEPESFAELIADYSNIKHLFFGHVHRPVSGSWRGIPFSAIVSTNHQVAMDFEAPHIIHSGGDPGYNVVLLDQDLSVIHMHSYVENPVWLKRDTAS